MARIPHTAHFVYGLRPQTEPFHLLHFLAIESCRQLVQPDEIFVHLHHLPYGEFWDAIRPHVTLKRVDFSQEVHDASYDEQLVPEAYRYAHHADFVRLDALVEHGGIYADIDTVFLRPLPESLYEQRFVIGREPNVADELTGEVRPSLCNALLMSEPGGEFAREWRQRMGAALNGTWSNHSGFLAQQLSEELPHAVHVEPEASFFAFPCSADGLRSLFEGGEVDTERSYSIHLWEHVWRDLERTDFSNHYAAEVTVEYLRGLNAPLGELTRPYLPTLDVDDLAR